MQDHLSKVRYMHMTLIEDNEGMCRYTAFIPGIRLAKLNVYFEEQ